MTTPKDVNLTKNVDDVEARAMFAGDAAGPVSLGQYWQQYRNKLRAGDVGSLPAVLGLLVLFIIFTIASPSSFLTTFNLANLITQAGSICVLAMGIGLFAPPFGVGYYAACAIGRVDPAEGVRPIWGYLLALMVGLIIVAIFPWISIGFL